MTQKNAPKSSSKKTDQKQPSQKPRAQKGEPEAAPTQIGIIRPD